MNVIQEKKEIIFLEIPKKQILITPVLLLSELPKPIRHFRK